VSNVPPRGVEVITENIPPKCEEVCDNLRIDIETAKEIGNYKLAVKSKYSTATRISDCVNQ
jgi:hypothetical protein